MNYRRFLQLRGQSFSVLHIDLDRNFYLKTKKAATLFIIMQGIIL